MNLNHSGSNGGEVLFVLDDADVLSSVSRTSGASPPFVFVCVCTFALATFSLSTGLNYLVLIIIHLIN